MTSRHYDAIDERVAAEIKRLHKRHPRLGHDGLLDALTQLDIHVDPQELEVYLKGHHIRADRPWQPWKLPGLPVWWGGRTDYRPGKRWRFWHR